VASRDSDSLPRLQKSEQRQRDRNSAQLRRVASQGRGGRFEAARAGVVIDFVMPPKAKGKSTAALRRLLDGQEQLKVAGDLGEGGATALAQAIKTNNSLSDMYLWQTHLKAQGVTAIAEALVGNTTIKHLTIGEDSLTDHHSAFAYGANDIGPEGAKVLAQLLRKNDTLELLNLWGVGVGEQGAGFFADVLNPACAGHNTKLEWLGLEKNEIGEIGCTALSECLQQNCYLVAKYPFPLPYLTLPRLKGLGFRV